jgi:hypothetical protein
MTDDYFNPYLDRIKNFPWFNHDFSSAAASPIDGIWVLQDFLTGSAYNAVKHDIRFKSAEWHNKYGNRHLSENGDYPAITELGARLIPYLNCLLNIDVKLITVRTYVDLSGSWFYPHLDGKAFAVNLQIYMTDLDYPELGTQFCTNQEFNNWANENEQQLLQSNQKLLDEKDFFTVPFRQNWGYINDNRQRKVHKTLPVPLGTVRESIHFNYGLKDDPRELGLELPWAKDQKWYQQHIVKVKEHYEQARN